MTGYNALWLAWLSICIEFKSTLMISIISSRIIFYNFKQNDKSNTCVAGVIELLMRLMRSGKLTLIFRTSSEYF
jgi:hypothetical protein